MQLAEVSDRFFALNVKRNDVRNERRTSVEREGRANSVGREHFFFLLFFFFFFKNKTLLTHKAENLFD